MGVKLPPSTQIRVKLKAQQGRCLHQVDCETPNPGILNNNCFCYNKTSQFSQNPPVYQKHQNNVLHCNVIMDVSPESGSFEMGCRPNFSASISHICEEVIKQEEPLNLIFKNIE